MCIIIRDVLYINLSAIVLYLCISEEKGVVIRGYKVKKVYSSSREGGDNGHWSPKVYYNVFLFVGLTAFGMFKIFIGWFIKLIV